MDEANAKPHSPPEPVSGFETLLWDLFLRLMDVPGDRVEAEILDAQRRLCDALDLDRSSFWQTRPDDGRRLVLTHFYDTEHGAEEARSADGSVTRGQDPEFLLSSGASIRKYADASDHFPWITRRILAGETVVLPSVGDLPQEATQDHAMFAHFGARSIVIVPLTAHGEVLGLMEACPTAPQLELRFVSEVQGLDYVASVRACV